MDLQRPGDVLGTIARMVSVRVTSKVPVFAAAEKTRDCVEAMPNGANGYVAKGSSSDDLFEAIRVIMDGREFVSPKLAVRVIREANRRDAEEPEEEITLTCRENQVVGQLLKGASNREIVQKLRLWEETVKYYMTQIIQKLDARNRLDVALAVQKARQN